MLTGSDLLAKFKNWVKLVSLTLFALVDMFPLRKMEVNA